MLANWFRYLLPGAVIDKNNWPSFYPLVHHDIAGDIPIHLQRIQYIAYATLLGTLTSLIYIFSSYKNVMITLKVIKYDYHMGWFRCADFTFLESYNKYSSISGVYIFFSIIYFLLGPPGAFYFWYRPLYRAFRKNNGMNFGCFFFNYAYHIVFFGFAAIGPRIVFSGLEFAYIMSFIGFGFFATELVLSIWVMHKVYRVFRGNDKATAAPISIAL
ncbi:hypothetical protein HanOQP8_Chr01g0007091 [Helianthus annuus]|nr:hypothetical protein HanOQP8_Chr01g0007091 [Helianthus annuus]